MISKTHLRGIWSAVLTPFDADFSPDAAKAISYYRDLLDRGCSGLNVLGTTGEAMSLSVEQRVAFMERIAASDLPKSRIMTGSGAASLADAARLTRAAFDLGFAAALVMPPFFYRDVSDDGVARFFDALLRRVPLRERSIVLYNFPRMSGITFAPDLVDRLHAEFPGSFAGMKDSSNDRM
ncbi:MAG: dihydrodipicolinate synthase family protein, partial [Candidatus Eremiobacteraeota bacterium]|nr:dihydrodipicolinate synthase family protein [Candidatus Eremiobacteraeota bacterium]